MGITSTLKKKPPKCNIPLKSLLPSKTATGTVYFFHCVQKTSSPHFFSKNNMTKSSSSRIVKSCEQNVLHESSVHSVVCRRYWGIFPWIEPHVLNRHSCTH